MFCSNCGKEVLENTQYCGYCGAKLSDNPAENPGEEMPNDMNNFNNSDWKPNNGRVSFGEAIKLYFKNYLNFSGRASRSEYWFAYLFTFLVSTVAGILGTTVSTIISLAFLLPSLAIAFRRLHDIGKSGWWYLMLLIPIAGPIILLVYYCTDSQNCDNQWGPANIVNDAFYNYNQFKNQYVNTNNAEINHTDEEIFAFAQNHPPVNINTPEARGCFNSAISTIIPTYNGVGDLAAAIELCNSDFVLNNIKAANTDVLFVAFKGLGFFMGEGMDVAVLGDLQKQILEQLRLRKF